MVLLNKESCQSRKSCPVSGNHRTVAHSVAKALNVSRASVSKAVSRGEKLIDKNQRLWDLLKIS